MAGAASFVQRRASAVGGSAVEATARRTGRAASATRPRIREPEPTGDHAAARIERSAPGDVEMTVLLVAMVSILLIAAPPWLLFGKRAPSRDLAGAALEMKKLLPIHCRHFPQIHAILKDEDDEFMRRRAPHEITSRWRAERRQVLRLYIPRAGRGFPGPRAAYRGAFAQRRAKARAGTAVARDPVPVSLPDDAAAIHAAPAAVKRLDPVDGDADGGCRGDGAFSPQHYRELPASTITGNRLTSRDS